MRWLPQVGHSLRGIRRRSRHERVMLLQAGQLRRLSAAGVSGGFYLRFDRRVSLDLLHRIAVEEFLAAVWALVKGDAGRGKRHALPLTLDVPANKADPPAAAHRTLGDSELHRDGSEDR